VDAGLSEEETCSTDAVLASDLAWLLREFAPDLARPQSLHLEPRPPSESPDRQQRAKQDRNFSAGSSFVISLRIDSTRFGIVPRLRTSPSGSAIGAAIVSAWTSKPKNRNFTA